MPYKLRLRDIRKSRKLTQGKLANMLGISERMVGGWERGETAMTLEHAVNCAETLGCTPNDLCDWYTDHPEDRPGTSVPGSIGSDESALLRDYRVCTPDYRRMLLKSAAAFRDSSKASGAGSGSCDGEREAV